MPAVTIRSRVRCVVFARHPFDRSQRGFGGGAHGSGTLIAFATEPDNVAFDGDGTRNAPFTAGLLKHIRTHGLRSSR